MRASKPRSVFFLVLALGVVGLTLFWSLATRKDEEVVAPDFGGVYIEGVVGSPARVNPLFATENAADQTLVSLVFAGLTRLDEKGSPFPDMAETWSLSPDQLTYTFSLRPNLIWQDGVPVTSDDVLFTYTLLEDPGVPIPPPLAAMLKSASVSAPDDRTIVIRLRGPDAALPAYLTLGILPHHSLEGLTLKQVYDSFFNQNPIGSGPYRLARLTPSEAELVANPAYHLDQPFLQQMELRFYRDEAGVQAALEQGEITAGLFRGGLGEAGLPDVNAGEKIRLTALDTGEVTSIYLNLTLPLFQDRRIRQALLYALDRGSLVATELDGQAVVAESPLSPASWAYSPSLRRYEGDPKLAGPLLDEAGWLLSPDGVRRSGDQALAFTLLVDTDPVRTAVAQQVAAAWNQLGAQVQVTNLGASDLVREHLQPRNFQAMLLTDAAAPDPDPYERWHSATATDDSDNLSGFSDSRVDKLLSEAQRVSQPERRDLYAEFQEIFAQEVPSIPLYVATATYAQQASLQGVRVGLLTSPGDRFWQVQEWFLKTR